MTDRILSNDFSDSDSFKHYEIISEIEASEKRIDLFDNFQELERLENDKASYVNQFDESFYELQHHFLIRQIQEKYLKNNEIGIRSLISIFQQLFPINKKYSNDLRLQSIWDISRSYVFLDYVNLGGAPVRNGETEIFKNNLQELLKDFKEKYKILFPLLQPINVTIIYIPPKTNIIDLDNLARYIVPFINEIYKPPSTIRGSINTKYLDEPLKKEFELTQKIPLYSISGYQIINIPRKETDPENGKIGFIITDGIAFKSNVWHLVDDTIEKWEDRI